MSLRNQLLALISLTASVGCGGGTPSSDGPTPDSGLTTADTGELDTGSPIDAPEDSGPPIGVDASPDAKPGPPTFDVNAGKRASCAFGPGSKTTETVGPMVPHGDALPFKHIVVLTLENRSFDHYYSELPSYGVTDVDVASKLDSNPDPATKKPVERFHETRYCTVDVAHNWSAVHLQYDEGLMDGFVHTSNPGGARAMGYYDQTDIPYYYWLSKTFAISDRHFCSTLGPTWPNRFYFYGATSWGRTHTPDTPPLGKTKITNLLEDAKKSWKIYRDGATSFAVVFGPSPSNYGSSMSTFDSDVKDDKLPELAIIDPSFTGGASGDQNDEHPPANVQKGQKFVERVVKALTSNPEVWKKTVLIITYDEHGGYYDHVAPPAACIPDGDKPPDFAFDRLGFRVPLIVISPFAKKGYVSHTVTDHTSVTRFIENRFDLPAMTNRDANAWPMLDMFDFEKPPFMTPPTGAPAAVVSGPGLEQCKGEPGTGKP